MASELSLSGSGGFITSMKKGIKTFLESPTEAPQGINGKGFETYQRTGEVGQLTSRFVQWRDEHRHRETRTGASSAQRSRSGASLVSDLNTSHVGKIMVAQLTHLLKTYGDKKTRCQFSRPSFTKGVPDYHKSGKWPCQEDSKTCHRCNKPFGALMDPKLHCRLCGFIHCRNHAQKQFILFVDHDGQAQWCINGVNVPVNKPENYVELMSCDMCIEKLKPYASDHSVKQELIDAPTEDEAVEDSRNAVITAMYKDFTVHQNTVSLCLPRYTELLDEFEKLKKMSRTPSGALQEDISRLHCNLEDAFKGLADITLRLKHVDRDASVRRKKLAENFFNGCQSFHTTHIQQFRAEQPRVAVYLPKINHKNVIIGKSRKALEAVYLVVMQLTYELLALGNTHSDLEDIQEHLKQISDIVHEEVEGALLIAGESCDEYDSNAHLHVETEMRESRFLIPQPDYHMKHYPRLMRQHVLKYCQAQLNKCNRYLVGSTTVNGCEASRSVIQSKLIRFHSFMEFS